MTMTLEQAQSPSYNPPAVRDCNPPLGCFGSGPAAPPGKPDGCNLTLLLLCGDNLRILVMIWPSLPDETRNWRAHRSPWESNFHFPQKVFINKPIQILKLPWCLSAWCVWRDLLHRLFLECALKIKFDLQTEIQKCSLKIKLNAMQWTNFSNK